MCKYLTALLTVAILVVMISPVATGELASGSVDVTINVGEYSTIEIIDNWEIVDFGEVLGALGIYHNDGTGFLSYLQTVWPNDSEGNPWTVHQTWPREIARVIVRANTDVNVGFEFDPIDPDTNENTWLESESIFGVWTGSYRTPSGYHGRYFGTASGHDMGITTPLSYSHSNYPGQEEYWLVGGFLIEHISQQKADTYTATIKVTVSAD